MLKNMFKKDVNMLSGSITAGILSIAIPIMIMNVLSSLFNIIDMTVLKTFGGGYTVGSVGACGTLITLITGLVTGCSAGSNAVIARHIGRGDKEMANRAVGTAIAFALTGGLLLTVVGLVGARYFLVWTNCPDLLLDDAVLYFRLYFLGVPILSVYNFAAAILRSKGDSNGPMIYLTIGGIVKVLLTLLFVGAFKLSIVGVALATIISWGVFCFLGVRALILNRNEMIKLSIRKVRFYKNELVDTLALGIPAGLQQAMYTVANLVISAKVNSFGPDATTGISIANQFDGILYQIATAPSLALLPYISQNLGANNLKRAKESIVKGIMIAVVLAGSMGAFSAIFSGPLSSIMSDNPAVIEYSQQKMVIISSTYFICGIQMILVKALIGFKRPIIPTVTTFLFMCVIRFPWVYLIFPLYPNMTFLYLVWPIGWVLSIITMLCFFIPTVRGDWQKRFNIKKENT